MKVKSIPRLTIFLTIIFLTIIFLAFPIPIHNTEYEYFDNTEFMTAYTETKTETQYNLEQYHEKVNLLARLIDAESGGEPYEGKLAVGNVVMNRVLSPDFPNTLEEVIFAPGQFCVVRNGSIYKQPGEESIKAAIDILSGYTILERDVLFFYNPEATTNKAMHARQISARIGNHNFSK